MVCKGTCTKYLAIKPSRNLTRYGVCQKRCSMCEIFVEWDGKMCPCCGYLLRTKPRATKLKRRFSLMRKAKEDN